jgi:hypothetical protein
MRTNYVLIDFENVQPDSLTALQHDHFKVIVFVGATQNKLSFDVVSAVQRMGTKAEYIKITGTGANALDFHIAFYIGQLAAKDDAAYFHVISKDSGFDPLIQHLKEKKISADRLACISDIPLLKVATGTPLTGHVENTKAPVIKAPIPPPPAIKSVTTNSFPSYEKIEKIPVTKAPITNPPVIKAAITKTPQELLQSFVAKLKLPKATRPRTVKTMSSAINALFQKQLSESDVSDIVAAMQAKKFITVAGGKITYNF